MIGSELNAAIARVGVSKKSLAEGLGISRTCLNNKIRGVAEFKGSEIKKLAQMLQLSSGEINQIFFGADVN